MEAARLSFVLVTGNRGKLEEARRVLGAGLAAVEVDLPEIQSLDPWEVLEAKADEAWRRVGRPLLVEETGLELAALHGFPGPLVKWMLRAVGAEGIARTAEALGDPRAIARCNVLYVDDARRVRAEGAVPGRLVLPARGTDGFGWDPVFAPDGQGATYAEMDGATKDGLSHRAQALRALMRALRLAM
jgi:non-canonical purine NTP pyrophosphatase (RdgB/HAM1 family)